MIGNSVARMHKHGKGYLIPVEHIVGARPTRGASRRRGCFLSHQFAALTFGSAMQ